MAYNIAGRSADETYLMAWPNTQQPAQKLTNASRAAKKVRQAAKAVVACHCRGGTHEIAVSSWD